MVDVQRTTQSLANTAGDLTLRILDRAPMAEDRQVVASTVWFEAPIISIGEARFLVSTTDSRIAAARSLIEARDRPPMPLIYPYHWPDGPYGGIVSISWFGQPEAPGGNGYLGRWWIAAGDPASFLLARNRWVFTAIGETTHLTIEATWTDVRVTKHRAALEQMESVMTPLGVHRDLARWEVAIRHLPTFAGNRVEQALRTAWFDTLQREIRSTHAWITHARKQCATSTSSASLYRWFAERSTTDTAVALIADRVARYRDTGEIAWLIGDVVDDPSPQHVHAAEQLAHSDRMDRGIEALPGTEIISMALQSSAHGALLWPRNAQAGLTWPCLTRGDLEHRPIIGSTPFPTGYDANRWWRAWNSSLSFLHIQSGDALDPFSPERLRRFPTCDDPVQADLAADALNQEALDQRQWAIPPGATVVLETGPISTFTFEDAGRLVFVTGRTAQGCAVPMCVELDTKRFTWLVGDNQVTGTVVSVAERNRIDAAMRLLVSAMIRDFLVVEERERVFDERLPRRPGRGAAPDDDRPRIIYLPRIRYRAAADRDRLARDLGTASVAVSKHLVTAHVRRCENPSADQLLLAERYRVAVPAGFTFVRPHERGGTPRDIIYRSRSALQALYQEAAPHDPGETAPERNWFAFERAVKAWLEARGFGVEHRGANPGGDRGVDLVAMKGSGLDLVRLIVQCKCYRADRPIRPAVVRELAGVISTERTGTRGVIVTTSGWTAAAATAAIDHGILLLAADHLAGATL